MHKAFRVLASLLLVVVLAEFFFAASGAFGAGPGRDSYRPHHALGYVIFLLPLVMAIVAALGRLPRRLVWLAVSVAGLTGVQVAIAKTALAIGHGTTAAQVIFGLHALGGLSIVAVTTMIIRGSKTVPDL
jgi:uncharacterized protein DUF6220